MKSQSLRTPVRRIALWAMAAVIIYGFGTVTISLGRTVRDRHASYQGIVVARGKVYHWIVPPFFREHYIVIRDSSGAESRRYVSVTEYLMADPGTLVEKPPGFSALVRRPGQLTPYREIDSIEALKTEKDPARRDSLLAHLRR
jgi:hypothetical protein